MRCMKKPEHGGVFHTVHQCMFLMYTPVRMHYFLLKGKSVPYPIELYKETVRHLIDAQGIDINVTKQQDPAVRGQAYVRQTKSLNFREQKKIELF